MFFEDGAAHSFYIHLWDTRVSIISRPFPFSSCSLLYDIVPCHLAADAMGLESAYFPAILQPLSSGALLWDHLAGVNTFPTKPAWTEASVSAVLNRVMEIPGYLRLAWRRQRSTIFPLFHQGLTVILLILSLSPPPPSPPPLQPLQYTL